MPKFAYVAVDPDGATLNGVTEAATLAAARLAVVQLGLRIQRIEPKVSWTQLELTPSRLKPKDLMHFSRQLSAFLRAGIPILDALQVLAEESDRAAVRRVLAAVLEDLRAGSTLAGAIDRHPADFPDWYRGILQSAELTGRLDEVLDQLSRYIERDHSTRQKIKTAMTYPFVVLAMSSVTVVILAVFVLPKFEALFATLNLQLPLATRIMLGGSRFFTHWWWAFAGGLILLVLSGYLGLRTTPGRLLADRLLLRVPVLGETIKYAIVERFTRLMASMVDAGVPLPRAMEVATGSLNNLVYQRALAKAREKMITGDGLAQPIAATQLFPAVATQMIRVGEDTGTLDRQLTVAAQFYESELQYKIQRVTTLIEPIVIIIMGSIVGFVAVALVSAMYGIFGSAKLS